MYLLYPGFGSVPSTVQAWLEFGLEVMQRVVTNPARSKFEVLGPILEEMQESSLL